MAENGIHISITAQSRTVLDALGVLQARVGDLSLAYKDIGKLLLRTHEERWQKQEAPDGSKWKPLSEKYRSRKPRNKGKVLLLTHDLMDSLQYQASADSFFFGTTMEYGPLHQLGLKGSIDVLQFYRRAYRRKAHTRQGKKIKETEVKAHTVRGHTRMVAFPARPFLGVSESDEKQILRILMNHLSAAGK